MPNKVQIICWKYGHVSDLFLTRKGEERLRRQIPKMKAVCPTCKEKDTVNEPITILNGNPFLQTKSYTCRHGHLNVISPIGNMLNIAFGANKSDFVNVDGSPEELAELIDNKDISCNHVSEDGKQCGCKLKPVDNAVLSKPQTPGFRTKTRIGDLWDRAGLEPVRSNTVNERTGEIEASKTDAANRERLKSIQKRNRNMSEDRHPGKRIDKPTDNEYGRKAKNEVKSKW